MSARRDRARPQAPPPWWSPTVPPRRVLLSLAATPGPLPAVTAARLAAGEDPVSLLSADSPEPGDLAARLDALGQRLLLPGDPAWPFAAGALDPPCAWLFVAGPDPPPAEASVAVVGGRKASALRRATARSLAQGLAAAGVCVVSGGAVGVDASAHTGALDMGGHTVVVLGCGLDVPYPGRNVALFRSVRAAGGTLLGEHPPGTRPFAANFLPRNRLIAALSCAVVVVEAASESGSLSTARAAGSRGAGRVLAVPGAPWDPGAAGCNDLIRDGATLVRGLDDVMEALGRTSSAVPSSTVSPGLPPPPGAAGPSAAAGVSPRLPASPSSSGPPAAAATSPDLPRPAGHSDTPRGPPMPPSGAARPDAVVPPGQAMPPGSTPAARTVLQALGDGRVISLARLAAATDLDAPALAAALLELELAGFVRRSAAGAEALAAVPIDRGA